VTVLKEEDRDRAIRLLEKAEKSCLITEREFREIIGLSLALVSGLGIGFRKKRRACHLRVLSNPLLVALSILGMIAAAFGYLPPIGGAIAQEIIDLAAVLNAVRVALPTNSLTDF
jgi:hypothetical protein